MYTSKVVVLLDTFNSQVATFDSIEKITESGLVWRALTMASRKLTVLSSILVVCIGCSLNSNFSNRESSYPVEIHFQGPFHSDRIRIKVNNVLLHHDFITSDTTGYAATVFTELPGGNNKLSILMNNTIYAESKFVVRGKLPICVRRNPHGTSLEIDVDCHQEFAKIKTAGNWLAWPQKVPSTKVSGLRLRTNENWSFAYECFKNKRYDEARSFFWRIAMADSSVWALNSFYYLTASYLKSNMPDSAVYVYELATRSFPDDLEFHEWLKSLFLQPK